MAVITLWGNFFGDFCVSLQVGVQDGSLGLNPRSTKHYSDQGHSMLRADYVLYGRDYGAI